MKRTLFLAVFFISITAFSQSVFGIWKQIDDATGEAQTYIEIYKKNNGKAYGKIIKILNEEEQDAICDKCPAPFKGKPILGLDVLNDLKKDGERWSDGKLLKADTGKLYSGYIELITENKLKVRGYLGFAAIGKTQTWIRV